jgi:H+/Cl- antiporter ClcA
VAIKSDTPAPQRPSGQRPGHDEEQIVETAVKARQGFLDRPVLVVLCVSLVLAVGAGLLLGMIRL